ncbi:HlyD family secretion protein [Maricaulis sp.]|uniref:HlyD family secretion protein n=1 Tax=Maricaulis sp. TaxID=1486257 RepID=UPI003A90B97B
MTRFIAPALVIAVLLGACSPPVESGLHGYAEGDFIALAPDMTGRIIETGLREGDPVSAGAFAFRLDDTDARAALAAAQAQLAVATAQFDDAAAGARAPEIGAARDQLAQANAARMLANEDLVRARELFAQGHVSQARIDQAQTTADAANAQVSEMRQRLNLVQLPARENQLRALQAGIAAAQAAVDRAEFVLSQRAVTVPADGRVERQIRYLGEQASPALPVYTLLPDGAVHAVVLIPEAKLAATPVGTRLAISCDSCGSGLMATITRIDDEAQFTAPFIYSDSERSRLVYRAEARFDANPPPPGTPLRLEVR